MLIAVLVLVGLSVVAVLWLVSVYNGLVRGRNEVKNAWSQIDVQLKRRHDLVPNLVETVKGYAKHESETLQKVTAARNMAVAARGPAQVGAAESQLTAAVSGLFAIAEQYPDLKASANFIGLQEELTSTENRIGFARQAYNDSVMRFNNQREQFPNSVVAGSFEKAEMLELTSAAEREVPQIKF
jgi:LemA protein